MLLTNEPQYDIIESESRYYIANPHNIMSADERNDTIALLSLATYPYPGEKSKKHK